MQKLENESRDLERKKEGLANLCQNLETERNFRAPRSRYDVLPVPFSDRKL